MEILYVVGCIVIVKRSFLMLFVKIWLEMEGCVGVVMSPPHNGRVTNVILMVLV